MQSELIKTKNMAEKSDISSEGSGNLDKLQRAGYFRTYTGLKAEVRSLHGSFDACLAVDEKLWKVWFCQYFKRQTKDQNLEPRYSTKDGKKGAQVSNIYPNLS